MVFLVPRLLDDVGVLLGAQDNPQGFGITKPLFRLML